MQDKQVTDIENKKIPDFLWSFNLKTGLCTVDTQLPRFLNITIPDKLTLTRMFSLFESNCCLELKTLFKDVLQHQKSVKKNMVINAKSVRYLAAVTIAPDDKQTIQGAIQYIKPFPSKQQELRLIQHLFLNADESIMIANHEHTITMVNQAYCKETKYSKQELIGKPANILKSGHYSPDFYQKIWATVDRDKVWCGELLFKDRLDDIYAHQIRLQRIEFGEGTHFYVAHSQKLDESAQLLNRMAIGKFKKTELPDKASTLKQLQGLYDSLSSKETIVFAAFDLVLLQDIRPEVINWLLFQRFNRCKLNGFLGAINKDMFTLCFIAEKNADVINLKLNSVLNILTEEEDGEAFDLISVITMGVSVLSVDATSVPHLLAHSVQTLIANPHADEPALYYFDRRLTKRFAGEKMLAKLLHDALGNEKIEVHYQPIVDMKSAKLHKFEAIFRVQLDTDIEYRIQDLIRIAEEHNWIDIIDDLVAKKAISDLPKLQQYFKDPSIELSLNRSLYTDKLTRCSLESTLTLLQKESLDLSQITIEVTESLLIQNIEKQKPWFDKLQALGVQIALDDFGTGQSSLSYLSYLPVNILKIGRAFVRGLNIDTHEYFIIDMLCKLIHKMGGRISAEGCETEDELHMLISLNVDMVQGYFFDRPLPLEHILSGKHSHYQELLGKALLDNGCEELRHIMNTTFPTIGADDRLSTAKLFFEKNTEPYLVVLTDKQCSGVLYRHQVFHALSPYLDTAGEMAKDTATLDKRVHQVMDKEFKHVALTTSLKEVQQYFIEQSDSIIIVSKNKRCIGAVTVALLLQYQMKESGSIESEVEGGGI